MGYVMNIEPTDCPEGFFSKESETSTPKNDNLAGSGGEKQAVYKVSEDYNDLGNGHCKVDVSLKRPWMDTPETTVTMNFELN